MTFNQPASGSLPSQGGNNGKYLTTNGTVASWASVSASGMVWSQVASKSANYTVVNADAGTILLVNANAGAITISLPAASGFGVGNIAVRKTDSSANTVTIAPNLTDNIDGVNASIVLSLQNEKSTLVSDGSANWNIMDRNEPIPYAIAKGGSGATTALGARQNFGVPFSIIATKTGAYSVTTSDTGTLFFGDDTSASFTFSLPTASSAGAGTTYGFKKSNATANANYVSIAPNGTDTFDGQNVTLNLTQKDEYIFVTSDGTSNWSINSSQVMEHSGFSKTAGYYHSCTIASGTTSAAVAAGSTIYYAPFYVHKLTSFTHIGAEVTLAAGATGRIGLYANVNGMPSGSPLKDFGDIINTTSATSQITATPFTLSPGMYWTASVFDNTPTMRCDTLTREGLFLTQTGNGSGNPICVWQQAFTYTTGTALPSVGTLSVYTSSNLPKIFINAA